jgi:His-Xaa-Ser system radical SAM maturase HxsB
MKANYKLNLYGARKIGRKTLAIADHGQWCFIEDSLLKKISKTAPLSQKEFGFLEKKGLIITEDNISGIIKRQRNSLNHLFLGASLHIVVPTERCNHKCVYCHSSAKNPSARGFDMDSETAKKVVDFIFQTPSDAITIEFQGGEPLLGFDIIREITSLAKKKNASEKKDLRIALVSNLSLMDHDILRYLIKEKVGICTSLDGPEHIHNKNRPMTGGNSYKQTTYWINEINTNYNYPINALMVATKHSLPYPEEIVDEYIKNKLGWVKLRHLDALGFARFNKTIGYTAEEYFDFWKKAVDYIVKKNKEYFLAEGFIQLIMKKLNCINPNYADFQSPCGAVLTQLAYSHNGDIYTCDEGRGFELFKIGNVSSACYKDIIKSPAACTMILSSINDTLCYSCAYKPFCGLCPVCNYSEEGSPIPNLSSNMRCKIYKKTFDYIFSNLENPDYNKVFNSWAVKSS